jgi:hypothetical protein
MNAEAAERIREASRAGRLLSAIDAGVGCSDELTGFEDIVMLRRGEECCFYSDRFMSRSFAETAARVASGDPVRIVVESVRFDSATYPRPTPADAFTGPPYCLAADQLLAALAVIAGDERYADVRTVRASDGSLFLFSADHIDPDRAAAMAERLAVGQFDNP